MITSSRAQIDSVMPCDGQVWGEGGNPWRIRQRRLLAPD